MLSKDSLLEKSNTHTNPCAPLSKK